MTYLCVWVMLAIGLGIHYILSRMGVVDLGPIAFMLNPIPEREILAALVFSAFSLFAHWVFYRT